MSGETASSRRSFLKVGALLATPIAAPAVAAIASGSTPRDDEAAIRALHSEWLRGADYGLDASVRAIATDHAGTDTIRITADGRTATGRHACKVDLACDLPEGGTFAQMARLQGNALDRRTERRVLVADYVKKGEAWKIAGVALA
jgi:hypothetical protein